MIEKNSSGPILKLLQNKRETKAEFHFLVAREWRIFGEPKKLHHPLAYSAFEYRMAIERYLFELYYIILNLQEFDEMEISRKASTLKKLISAIYAETGGKEAFHKRLQFNRIVAENQITKGKYLRGRFLPAVFEINRLDKYWQKLSNYCHKQLKPKASWNSFGDDWVKNGYILLNEVDEYLFNIMVKNSLGWYHIDEGHIEIKEALDEYLRGKIDDRTLSTRITIMNPVFEMKNNSKK